MRVARGTLLAFALFAASFALHIVGGATDQGWLFAIAVVLIYFFAAGFPFVATVLAGTPLGQQQRQATLVVGTVAGVAFTSAAYWAANGRSFAWWEIPAAAISVAVVSGFLFAVSKRRFGLSLSAGEPAPRPGR
ncbi:MAG: hypothetical protein M0R74_12040 [Dehalococcoidia bacterium]|nr:hypothetical protein [Dehalococcoidia bacterium]